VEPSYLRLLRGGKLDRRIDELYSILESCRLCPRKCAKNRLRGEKGYCSSGKDMVVSAIHPHFGEEQVLVGKGGSGTIFLTNCNLGCIYCQNYDISHLGRGSPMSPEELAREMVKLQDLGCHNINLVTPTHFAPQLTKSIRIAAEKSLRIPIVYNCGGYESVETISLLEGIVDIYMPDIKYSHEESAIKYSNAPHYFESCCGAVKEMYRQVGNLTLDREGIAQRGLLIRHLVLPNDVAGSKDVLKFIASEISLDTYVNIMFQYRPMYQAEEYKEINRRPYPEEYIKVISWALDLGLHQGFTHQLLSG
jgi:putative pyruvate formate lyase activating enzyme